MDTIDLIFLILMLICLYYYDISSRVIIEDDDIFDAVVNGSNEISAPSGKINKEADVPTPKAPATVAPVPEPVRTKRVIPDSKPLTAPPGCEPDGPASVELSKLYPNLSQTDILRYLVARKGNVTQASEMIEKYDAWRAKNFPLKKEQMRPAFETGCIFSHGEAMDGSPVLYFRGGMYAKANCPPEVYALAAAHSIDVALQDCSSASAVTVLCHVASIKGGRNEPADINFIKCFVAVLSDNYPERLKRLIIYPFPWYGRAIWSMAKVFIDKRTQDKVTLLADTTASAASGNPPEELFKYVPQDEIPLCCGGTDSRSMRDLLSTLD